MPQIWQGAALAVGCNLGCKNDICVIFFHYAKKHLRYCSAIEMALKSGRDDIFEWWISSGLNLSVMDPHWIHNAVQKRKYPAATPLGSVVGL